MTDDLVDWADLMALKVRMLSDVEESRVVTWDQWWEFGPDRVDMQTAAAIRSAYKEGHWDATKAHMRRILRRKVVEQEVRKAVEERLRAEGLLDE